MNEEYCSHCKIPMEIHDYFIGNDYHCDESKLCCSECGLIIEKDISYVLTNIGYILKSPKPQFSPNKHFTEWLNHILGRTIPKDANVLKTIRHYITQNNIREISLESLRKILKALNLSKYYKYTSYFFAELTGIGPPKIPEDFLIKADFLFQKYIITREQIRKENPSFGPNNPQYPYLIYKILDVILPLDDTENRRIFHFIKLPSQAMLKKRDSEWDIVWDKLQKNN